VKFRGQVLQVRQAGVGEEFGDATHRDLVGDHLRFQIAQHLAWKANVAGKNFRQGGIPLAFADQARGENPDAFFEQFPAIRRPERAADIG
jgi:hypothetical protein